MVARLRRRRVAMIGVAIVAVLAVALIVNTILVDAETQPAEVTVAGGRIIRSSAGDLEAAVQSPTASHDRGAPIVLLPCYICSLHWYDRVVPLLDDHHRVVRLDLLGQGGSEKPARGYSVANEARLVAHALRRLGVRRAIVVGQSLGFDVATALGQRAPGLVAGLVNIGEAADNKDLETPFGSKIAYAPVVGEAGWQIAPDFAIRDGYGADFAPGYDISKGFADPNQVVEDFRSMTYTSFDSIPTLEDAYVARLPLDARIRRLKLPLLVIFGAQDQQWGNPTARAHEYRDVPGAKVTILPGVGHSPNVERPRRTARLILRFARTR